MPEDTGGNAAVSPSDISPSVDTTTTTETKPETTSTDTTATTENKTEVAPAAEEKMYDLPDGRKVTAAELHDLHVNKLLPDYTRKSQKLAEYERPADKNINNEPEWKKPDYVPKTYGEIVEIAKQAALADIARASQEDQERVTAITKQVDDTIATLKKSDPKLDENALFQHANKFGFNDLAAAHQNMTEMRKIALDTEQRVLKNIKARDADPVGSGAAGTAAAEGYDPEAASQFSGAVDFYRRLTAKN